MQIDLAAFANYALNTFDYSSDYEDDQFAVTFQDQRIYCVRKRYCFDLHIGSEIVQLPRA